MSSTPASGSGGMADDAGSIAQMLRDKGLRVTRPRVAVLELLVSTGRHLDAAAIIDHVRRELDGVSVQAVYDVLAALTRTGLARQLEPHARPAVFESRVGDNHHHLICRACGDVVDLDCGADSKPCLRPDHNHGFTIDEAEVNYYGLCAGCQAAPQ